MKLNENDLYRTSTQFRQWSFTAEQLAAQRAKANLQATERVKLNVARQRAQRGHTAEFDSTSGNSGIDSSRANTPNAVTSDKDVDCFTVSEELTFLEEFCERTMALGHHCKFSDNAVATAVQFLRRTSVELPCSLLANLKANIRAWRTLRQTSLPREQRSPQSRSLRLSI
jgi:cyclin H